MTQEEIEKKLKLVQSELKDIELVNDKNRRLRWRELKKIESWLLENNYIKKGE